MKILLLSDISSEHTQKWALGLASKGIEIAIFSLNHSVYDWFTGVENIQIAFQAEEQLDGKSFFEKLNYISVLNKVKKAIKEIEPDIVHAHYASSYGMLGALSKFHPFIVSVWGADVFDFPRQSAFHKKIFSYNLKKADLICSTSFIMKEETKKYTSKEIKVTPFGVDTEVFKPFKTPSLFPENAVVVGLVKSLEAKYGIEILIKAFARAKELLPGTDLRLLIVGKGSLENKLKELAEDLNISNAVIFAGKTPHEEVPRFLNMMDIFVSVSVDDSESFGVSAVEACSCAKAVIVSEVGGLKEVIINNKTGLFVPVLNVDETAAAMVRFAENPALRNEFGLRARQHVLENYNWKENLELMVTIYSELLVKD
ncbi:MAG: glycosyltransferase [Bacteroidia bacterium]|nr:glycosyltransferase [Bacteroidia bacterium]